MYFKVNSDAFEGITTGHADQLLDELCERCSGERGAVILPVGDDGTYFIDVPDDNQSKMLHEYLSNRGFAFEDMQDLPPVEAGDIPAPDVGTCFVGFPVVSQFGPAEASDAIYDIAETFRRLFPGGAALFAGLKKPENEIMWACFADRGAAILFMEVLLGKGLYFELRDQLPDGTRPTLKRVDPSKRARSTSSEQPAQHTARQKRSLRDMMAAAQGLRGRILTERIARLKNRRFRSGSDRPA